jgi:hypothetical protein
VRYRVSRGACHTKPPRERFSPLTRNRHTAPSVDHVIGAQHQPGRNFMTDRLCDLEIDLQVEVRRLLDREVRRFCAARGASCICRRRCDAFRSA